MAQLGGPVSRLASRIAASWRSIPSRTVAELEELRELTGDENGAQRVAWTDDLGAGAGVPAREARRRPARSRRSTRPATSGSRCAARSDRALLIGGHLDSVPNGGWLDGCLNVLAGVEVLRRIAAEGEPPVTVRLVDWADEEGARFGRSLFGSSAAAGSMRDQDELRTLTDRDGIALPDALREHGVELDSALGRALAARGRRGLPRAAHRAGARCSSRWTCRSASCSGRSASSARASPGAARPRTPARRRWTSAATRSPAPRSSRSRSARSPPRSATARSAPRAASSRSRGSSRRSSRRPSSCSTSATSTPSRSRGMLAAGEGRGRPLRRRGEHRGRVGADLEHRADPLRRDADRLRRRGDPRGRRARRTGFRPARCTTPPRSRARASRR